MEKLNKYKKILDKFNELNKDKGYTFYFGGSISILLQGVPIGREPHDVDIVIKDNNKTLTISNYLQKIRFPKDIQTIGVVQDGLSKYIDRIYFEYLDEKVDIFMNYGDRDTIFVDGFECVPLEEQLENKCNKYLREKDAEDVKLIKEFLNSKKEGV